MPVQSSDTVPVRWHALVLIMVVLLTGCYQPSTLPPDNPAYFDNVFRQVDSMNLSMGQSFRFIDSIYSHYPSPGVLDRMRRYDYKGSYYFYQAHDLGNSMRYIDSSLVLLSGAEEQKRFPRQYAKCLIDKAETYQLENNYQSALFYYRKGLEAIRDLGDSCSMAEYTQRVAMASFRAGRFTDARNLFELAYRQFAACPPSFRTFAYKQSNLDNIGECYAAMRKWDSAGFFYDSTLAFIGREGRPFLRDSGHLAYIETADAVVYGNQGDYFLARRDTAKAWLLYRQSITGNMQPLHDSGNALTILVRSAHLHLAQGHLAEVRTTLQEIRTILDGRPNTEVELDWRKLRADVLERSGDLSGAWKALNEWTSLNDSLHRVNAPISAMDMPGELVHLEDRYLIQLLQQRDHDKSIYLLFALLIVIMLAAIVFLILWSARKSKGHIHQLNRLNKALRAENRQTQMAINALNEDQSMYLRTLKTIAHDLRNPVGAISSAVSLLQQQEGYADQTKMILGLIRQAADQSLQLVGGIMNLDLPVGNLKMERIDVAKLLEICVATLQFKAGEKGQSILLEASPTMILADHDKLWRVIINLLDNAIKFSPVGADVRIRLLRQDDKAVISIIDKGIGIPKDIEGKLFSVDSGVKRAGTAGEASYGLGLAIVNQIIRAHGGTISIQSEEHQGTTFRIELQASAA